LLTINPSALLFNQINQTAAIQNNSVAPASTAPAGSEAFGLRVPDGKSLLLVGGNLSMDGGQLNAYSGRVELGGLAELGSVLLGVDADNLSLTFPSNVALADISLTNQAGVYVTGAGGGNIAVNARNLEILGGSILSGDITLNATLILIDGAQLLSGQTTQNITNFDPTISGLINRSAVPIDTEVAQTCTPGSSQSKSEFVVTGRGGLPPSPDEMLSSDAIQVNWVTLNPQVENRSIPDISTNSTAPAPAPIVEAQGWVIDDNGEVILTASAPSATPNNSWQAPANCHATRNSS
jgi:large exoprotein involved in heme utilization and adhesion